MFKLAPGNNVKAASLLCQMLQDRKIPVGLHRETNRVWNLAETAIKLTVSIRDSRPAIQISRSAKRSRRRYKVDVLTKNVLDALLLWRVFPLKVRRESSRIDERNFSTRIG